MLGTQIPLFEIPDNWSDVESVNPDLTSYDSIIVATSGGKDSIASFLCMLEQGADPSRIELWHHCVDGYGSTNPLMDWPVTEDYCRKFALAFGIPIYFSWKSGGFETEMLRENDFTRPVYFESPEGLVEAKGTGGSRSTRRRFPQLSAALSTRWCSSYLKIDPAAKALINQERFINSKTLVVTGERAQESAARAKYKVFEPHRTDRRNGKLKRHIDHFRPVHHWKEEQVWEIMQRFLINPHPAYRLGWGRLSCQACVFGSRNQWASVRKVAPDRFKRIADYESEFQCTINRKHSVVELADQGRPYETINDYLVQVAMSKEFVEPIFVKEWSLPAGAFGDAAGPT